jgi:hypothetical protein
LLGDDEGGCVGLAEGLFVGLMGLRDGALEGLAVGEDEG